MNRSAVGRCSVEIKSTHRRLSVRFISWLLSEPFAVNAIALVIIFAIFGG